MARPPVDEDDAAQLARLRVAVDTGRLPRDLGEWVLAKLSPASARRQERDACLRAAAIWVRGGPWARAKALQATLQGPGKGEPRDPWTQPPPYFLSYYAHEARRLDPQLPHRSRRTFLRVLARGRDR